MHYFFVVIDEHESVIIIGLKVDQFFCDVEKVQIGCLSKQQYTIWRQFLLKCPWSCFSEHVVHRVRREEERLKNLRILFNQELNPRISSCFSPLISSLQRAKSVVKTVSVSSDNDFAPLSRYISRSHNLVIKEVTNKKTGCTHVNRNWKGFIGLFSLDSYLVILWYFIPLHDVNYASKLVYRQILSHFSQLFKQQRTLSAYQHSQVHLW